MENQINLRWTSHTSTVLSMLDTLLSTESMVDVTLACDGQYVRAHKVVLSACSPYFQDLFELDGNKNPILYLRGVKLAELNALIQYMYRGEVSVARERLPSILQIAKELKIRGLSDVCGNIVATSIIEATTNSTLNSNSASSVAVLPVLVPSPAVAALTADSSPSSVPSIGTALSSTFVSSEPFLHPRLHPRPNAANPRKKLKADYTQRIKLKANPHARVLGQVSMQQAIPNLTLKKPQAQTYDPLESSHETGESTFEPADHQPDYNGEDEQLHSLFKQTDEQVKLEVLEGFEPEVVELEDDDSTEGPGAWDRSTELGEVMPDSSMETGGILLEDGIVGNEMPRRVRGTSNAEVQNLTSFDDLAQIRQRRSGVWQHFTTVASDDGDCELYSQCNYCHKKYKRSTSTTNMKSHLNLSHQVYF